MNLPNDVDNHDYQLLLNFLESWLAFAETADLPTHKYSVYSKSQSLCRSTIRYADHSYDEQMKNAALIRRLMTFNGLDSDYVTNSSKEEYFKEWDDCKCHTNPNRLAWVKDAITSIKKHLNSTTTTIRTKQPVVMADLLNEAEKIVRSKPLWGKYIDGTPLSTEIAIWMATFAHEHTTKKL